MAADPWDVFGSDSDEDPSAEAPSSKPAAAAAAAAASRLLAAKRSQKQKRYAWEALLPTFRFPDGFASERGGGGSNLVEGGQVANGGSTSRATDATSTAEEGAASTARAPFSAPPVYQHPSVRYEPCLPHRGGGRGFVAAADIAPGTLLLVERRFLPIPTAVECGLAGGMGQEELCLRWILELPSAKLEEVLGELRWLHPQALEDLPDSEAAELMSRHEQTAKDMLSRLDKVQSSAGRDASTNAFGLDVRGIVRLLGALQSNGFASGIYLHPAMTNHSCRPNAIKWRAGQSISDSKQEPPPRKRQGRGGGGGEEPSLLSEIRATELIREGEEITISYLEPREIALESRRSRLKDQFGFDCSCALCEGGTGTSSGGISGARASATAAALEGFVVRSSRGDGLDDQHSTVAAEEPHEAPSGATSHGVAGGASGKGEGMGLAEDENTTGEKRGEGEDDEEEDRGGLVARSVLERRLEAAESVLDLSRPTEVRWAGVLSEVLGYRRQAAQWLSDRHISLARADKLIAKACIAILQRSTEAAQLAEDCAESVQQASDELPSSFGGFCVGDDDVTQPLPVEGSFKTRLLAVFLASLISRRKTQLLYLGDGPHPEAGACLADLSQAMGMLLAQGSEGVQWIERLPVFGDGAPSPGDGEHGDEVLWLGGGGLNGASLFERECDKAAKRVEGLFDAPQEP
eukprot:g5961.t1